MSTSYHKHDKKASLSLAPPRSTRAHPTPTSLTRREESHSSRVAVALRSALGGPSSRRQAHTPGFTIVELLVVIVVVAILALISIVVYNGVSGRAAEASVQSDLRNAKVALEREYVRNGSFPADLPSGIGVSDGNSFQYTSDGEDYCITGLASNSGTGAYSVSNSTGVSAGACDGHRSKPLGPVVAGVFMQDIAPSNCPTERTRAVDARDNHTYWVKKMPDGLCWMLTNLGYAGGGDDTYGDARALLGGTDYSYTEPYYYVPTGANVRIEPASPSAYTNGSGQYGYLYNWCAAMGVQVGTGACLSGNTPAANLNVSLCPSGWRLPAASEYAALNSAINGGSTTSDSGLLNQWHAMRAGWFAGPAFVSTGSVGHYWTSTTEGAALSGQALTMRLTRTDVRTSSSIYKFHGISVRCVAI